ncbi:MAG: plasmid recombination protein [Lachnospiraceae bacterium]|nr:plasmid recombination protein [Lachnospiraceae bacterium]
MAKTISFVKGKGSLNHDNREFVAANVDPQRISWNETFVRQSLEAAYGQIFGEAVREYNEKQKRSDRKIDDYLGKIKNSGNNEKTFYETVVQVGKRDDTGVLDEGGNLSEEARLAKEVLEEYARTFQERNPNLYLFNAVLHMDESTPHLHLDYVPVAHGYRTGLKTRNSLTKALQEMGIAPAVSKNDTETMHWQERERDFLGQLCRERGIETEILGESHGGMMLPEYRKAQREVDEMESQLEILGAEKQELESELAASGVRIAESESEEERHQEELKRINQEIEQRRERLQSYKDMADSLAGTDGKVGREIERIRQEAKLAKGILDPEPMVKIPEKTFERLLGKYRQASMAEYVTAEYEKVIGSLRDTVEGLRRKLDKVNRLADRLGKFVSRMGLTKEWEESERPKTLKEKLEEGRKAAKEYGQEKDGKKNQMKVL